MTFEEWFEKEFVPSFHYTNDDPYKYESAVRRAWEAGFDAGRDFQDCESNQGTWVNDL